MIKVYEQSKFYKQTIKIYSYYLHDKFSADVLSISFPQKKKVLQNFYMASTNPRSSFDDWIATLLEDEFSVLT